MRRPVGENPFKTDVCETTVTPSHKPHSVRNKDAAISTMRCASVGCRQLLARATCPTPGARAPCSLPHRTMGHMHVPLCIHLLEAPGRRTFATGGPPPNQGRAEQPSPLAAAAPLATDSKDAPKVPTPAAAVPTSSIPGVLAAAVVAAGSFALADAGGAALMAAQGIVGAGSPISGVPVAVRDTLPQTRLRACPHGIAVALEVI